MGAGEGAIMTKMNQVQLQSGTCVTRFMEPPWDIEEQALAGACQRYHCLVSGNGFKMRPIAIHVVTKE